MIRVQAIFEQKAREGIFSGEIMIAKDQIIKYQAVFGQNIDEVPLQNNAVFELASVSKPITALGIMLLQQQGKLQYDDAVAQYLTSFPYPTLTIRQLLNHSSGLPDYMALIEQYWSCENIATNEDVLQLLNTHQQPLLFTPDTKQSYSNTGYVCLAQIITEITGSYTQFMRQVIFEPLQMQQTAVYHRRYTKQVIPSLAYGLIHCDNKFVLPDTLHAYDFVRYLDGIQGDGMVHATAQDLLKLSNVWQGDALLHVANRQAITAPNQTFAQGIDNSMGWFFSRHPQLGQKLYHTGSWPGYTTCISMYLDTGYTVIILCNVEQNTHIAEQESASDWLQYIEDVLVDG